MEPAKQTPRSDGMSRQDPLQQEYGQVKVMQSPRAPEITSPANAPGQVKIIQPPQLPEGTVPANSNEFLLPEPDAEMATLSTTVSINTTSDSSISNAPLEVDTTVCIY